MARGVRRRAHLFDRFVECQYAVEREGLLSDDFALWIVFGSVAAEVGAGPHGRHQGDRSLFRPLLDFSGDLHLKLLAVGLWNATIAPSEMASMQWRIF